MGLTRMLVATDVRLRREHDGSVLSTHLAGLYETFVPLTQVYGSITLFARTAPTSMPSVGSASGTGVEVAQVPDFTSVRTLLVGLPRILWRAWKEAGRHDVTFGRLPEPLSLIVGWAAVLRRRPFIANLVADPTASRMGKGAIARLGNRAILAATRALVQRSTATVYVTQ